MTRKDGGISPPSPDQQRIAAERLARANQVIASEDYDYAVSLLTTCCKIDPANLLYRQTLRRAQKAKFGDNLRGSRFAFITTARARTRLKVAQRNRDYCAVLEHGEDILTRNPWDMGVQLAMAEAADAAGIIDIAIFILDQARQKTPKNATLNRALARLFEKRGNYKHAIALWVLVKEVAPDDVEAAHKAKNLAATDAIRRGGYDGGTTEGEIVQGTRASTAEFKLPGGSREFPVKAQPADRVLREAEPLQAKIEANSNDPMNYLDLANVYRKYRQYDRAKATLEQGLAPTGNHFRLTLEILDLSLAETRARIDQLNAKIKELEASDYDPDTEEVPKRIKRYKRERQDLKAELTKKEVSLYTLKVEHFPHDNGHRLELGTRLFDAGQLDEAINELQTVRKDTRLGWKAAIYLGHCFAARNHWRLAQRNYEEALAAVPESEAAWKKEILFHLASGLAKNGDIPRALDLGHELANLDFKYKGIGPLLEEWEQQAKPNTPPKPSR